MKGHKMAKPPSNHGKGWSPEEVAQLRTLAAQNTPTRVIGIKMDRTESAVYAKASAEGISLKPSNQSPYNRQKKPK
jgi:hypothetical protein